LRREENLTTAYKKSPPPMKISLDSETASAPRNSADRSPIESTGHRENRPRGIWVAAVRVYCNSDRHACRRTPYCQKEETAYEAASVADSRRSVRERCPLSWPLYSLPSAGVRGLNSRYTRKAKTKHVHRSAAWPVAGARSHRQTRRILEPDGASRDDID